jgi:hypothetical protein
MKNEFTTVSVETLNSVVNYLANRPWKEVNGLLTRLSSDSKKSAEQAKPVDKPSTASKSIKQESEPELEIAE